MRETSVRSPGWKDPLEKETVTHSSILAWRIPWTEDPGGLQSTGSQRVRHDWVTSLSLSLLWPSFVSWYPIFLFPSQTKQESEYWRTGKSTALVRVVRELHKVIMMLQLSPFWYTLFKWTDVCIHAGAQIVNCRSLQQHQSFSLSFLKGIVSNNKKDNAFVVLSWLPAAAAAAKSLQLCPTLCDPTDGSPPGSAVPGILQARTLEWVAVAFSLAPSSLSLSLFFNWTLEPVIM